MFNFTTVVFDGTSPTFIYIATLPGTVYGSLSIEYHYLIRRTTLTTKFVYPKLKNCLYRCRCALNCELFTIGHTSSDSVLPVVLRILHGIIVRTSVWFQLWYAVFFVIRSHRSTRSVCRFRIGCRRRSFLLYIWWGPELLCFWLYTYNLNNLNNLNFSELKTIARLLLEIRP